MADKNEDAKKAAGEVTAKDSAQVKKLEDLQVEGAKNKAEVISSPSLAEQARQVNPGYPGWHKPASDLQEPGKVEGALLTDEKLAEEKAKGPKPRYIAGRLEPVYIDEKKFDELQKKLDDVRLKQYKGVESDIPQDNEYWKLKQEQADLLKNANINRP